MTGPQALEAFKNGHKIRCTRWTAGCFIKANWNPDGMVYDIIAAGTDIFVQDVEQDGLWILSDLIDGDWEIVP